MLPFFLAALLVCAGCEQNAQDRSNRLNVVLVMSDDQGWGDVAYNGNPIAITPHLDAMAAQGVRLDRFYTASPVCSPTRASLLTGRHPARYGLLWAGQGHLPARETTIAEALKAAGYRTGHFGKWHVGELSKTVNQSYFAGDTASPEHYSPPWENGFDESFSTESMMPTYNPYYQVGGDYGDDDYRFVQTAPVAEGQRHGGFRWRDHFWSGPGQMVDEWLQGDSSQIVMDRALNFIERASSADSPFLAVIWFYTPHTPVVAGDEDRALYSGHETPAQHWFGSLTAMDRQIGRLRQRLRELDIAGNTLLWFNSDNGPSYIHQYNSAGPFSGKKGELKEGGVRVPAIVEWPDGMKGGSVVSTPISTSDIYPTVMAATEVPFPSDQGVLDGMDVSSFLRGEEKSRPAPIAFQSPVRGEAYDADYNRMQYALSGNRFKLYSGDGGASWELYDIAVDPGETENLAAVRPEILSMMRERLTAWVSGLQGDVPPSR